MCKQDLWAALLVVVVATSELSAQRPIQGIVVESVANHQSAQQAGLQAGDLLLTWSRGEDKGNIGSPLDLGEIETEEAPRGPVKLEGIRGSERRVWTLGAATWGITARPELPERLFALYQNGQKLAKDGKALEAAEQWQKAAEISDAPALSTWLLFYSAELLGNNKKWQQADGTYKKAAEQAVAIRPSLAALLFRKWAVTYLQRNDWKNAEAYCQRSLEESQKESTENLASAAALNHLSTVAGTRGDLAQAESYTRRALAIQQKLAPDSLPLAASLSNLAHVLGDRGDLVQAEQYYQQVLAIQKKLAPDTLELATSFSSLAQVVWRSGDLTRADEYLHEALEIQEKLAPAGPDVARTCMGLGAVAGDRGDFVKADEYFRRALLIQQRLVPGSPIVAGTLMDLGRLAQLRSDVISATNYFRQALKIKNRLVPGSLELASVLDNLGLLASYRADLDDDEGLPAHNNDLEEAASDLRGALAIQEKLAPNSSETGGTLGGLGAVAEQRGNFEQAEHYYNQALEIRQKTAPGSLDVAMALHALAAIARKRGDWAKAQDYYQEALEIREKLAPGSTEHAETLAGLAEVMRQQPQHWDAAAGYYERALNALESQNARLGGSAEAHIGFRAEHADIYGGYIDLLIAQQRPEEAFHALERSRAQTLLGMLSEAKVDIRHGVDPSLLENERSLQKLISAKSQQRIQLAEGPHTEVQLEQANKKIDQVLAQYEEVEGEIHSKSPAYAALTQPKSLTAEEIQQQLLDDDTIVLEYFLGKEHSYLLALNRTSLTAHELPGRAKIEKVARHIYRLLTEPNRSLKDETEVQRQERLARAAAAYPTDAASLSRMILGPVATEINGKRLLIVSDGALQYIPFAALPTPESVSPKRWVPLIAKHEIVNLPSVSVLSELRRAQANRKKPSGVLAVLADPVFEKDDPRIQSNNIHAHENASASLQSLSLIQSGSVAQPSYPIARALEDLSFGGNGPLHLTRLVYTRREAENILAVTPKTGEMHAFDFQASRTTALSPQLAGYRIVHFATHGLLDSKRPQLSALLFSMRDKQGNPQNGVLDLEDVYNMDLPADLVVLSACETALGKQVDSEGILGLTRGFMYAGASRVVASLWQVDDVATAELMKVFYRAMEKEQVPPAAALRQAQIEMRKQKRWSSPYYWAAFQMQGEWK